MRQYGIINNDLFTPEGDDVQWTLHKVNEDLSVTDYECIETSRDLSANPYTDMKGDAEIFNTWAHEFTPPLS